MENKSDSISETRKDGGKVTTEGLYQLTNAISNGITPTPYGLPFLEIVGLQLNYPFYLRNR